MSHKNVPPCFLLELRRFLSTLYEFVPVETGINTLQSTCLRLGDVTAVTLHVMKCYFIELLLWFIYMLSIEDKIFIKNLWEWKQFSTRRLLYLPNRNGKNKNIRLLSMTVEKTALIECTARSGEPRSCWTADDTASHSRSFMMCNVMQLSQHHASK